MRGQHDGARRSSRVSLQGVAYGFWIQPKEILQEKHMDRNWTKHDPTTPTWTEVNCWMFIISGKDANRQCDSSGGLTINVIPHYYSTKKLSSFFHVFFVWTCWIPKMLAHHHLWLSFCGLAFSNRPHSIYELSWVIVVIPSLAQSIFQHSNFWLILDYPSDPWCWYIC